MSQEWDDFCVCLTELRTSYFTASVALVVCIRERILAIYNLLLPLVWAHAKRPDLRRDPLVATPSFVVKHVVTTTTLVRTDGSFFVVVTGCEPTFLKEPISVFEGKMG